MCQWLALGGVLFWSVPAFSMGPIPGEERLEGLSTEPTSSAGGEIGVGAIGGDWYLQLTPRLDLNLGKIGLGLQVPLNLRVWDKEKPEDELFKLREEDWDEVSDYFKLIRYVRYGHKHSDDLIYARVGELAAEIGHGTIMSRYMNNLDVNTFRLGSQLDVYTNYGGVETVVGDYGSLASDTSESRIVGGRAYVKPYAFVDPESWLNIFSVGVSVITDTNAPRTIAQTDKLDENGNPVLDSQGAPVRILKVDDHGDFAVATAAAESVFGFDLEVQAVNTEILKVTPYTDLNFIGNAGWGYHLGTLVTFRFPVGFELTIPVRLEYRRFRNDYVPAYFSTFYELERYSYPVDASVPIPKARFVRDAPDDEGLNGFYGDLAFDFAQLFQIGAIYEGYQGQPSNVAAFLNVPALEIIQLKAYYAKTRVRDGPDLFELDERSMLIAQARYELTTFVYLVGQWSRRWTLETRAENKSYGTFQPEDDWKVGLEVAVTF